MTLEDLGYRNDLEKYRKEQHLDSFGIGRIIKQHKDRYSVKTISGELDCELIGNLRFTLESETELPAVGDWVSISEYDTSKGLIHAVLPRFSILERKAVGKKGQSQIIATNIDVGLIIQSINRDFSVNRLERYITICNTAKIEPVIVLSKIDLLEEQDLEKLLIRVKERIKNVVVYAISNLNKAGIDGVKSILKKGKTYCLLGSSGVGKSTLINVLAGEHIMNTGEISEAIDRGKHVTTHRELIVFEDGILIDNPGMREIGITESRDGIEMTFDEISALSKTCKYKDCKHISEYGCAVLIALENDDLSLETYENYLKMEKERMHFESSSLQRKKKGKDLGKLIKNMKKNHNKY
ncbi:ribosome small subunit-dependent GTPase A [Lutimonas zeaxanthinifaciens]|uniref:ribosome small subunit-dependent GTPase A n=1 Tax=Lutimonas zeaxanthinifaciens TaxID=3060215 RepID=UPI00265D140B|nr:ribosome small subunit-dependent GTPase A [Lutimonas sp. YSD2104]WKK67052.1 ribosome small subunit-dependent GTPase A [Lutimonas sp. YSD2104]